MSLDRVTFDGDRDHLDEIVLTGTTVHLEALGTHDYMLILSGPGERHVHLNVRDPRIFEERAVDDLVRIREPLLGCSVEWETGDGRRHRCDRGDFDGKTHRKHKCDCGARP